MVKIIKGQKKLPSAIKPQTAYPAKFTIQGNNLVLKLPKSVLNYTKFSKQEICWTIINNIIQISGKQPTFFIPAINLDKDEFSHQH